ncbi:MAG: hypothetical protein ABL870_12820 [Sediminibacterium sp.]
MTNAQENNKLLEDIRSSVERINITKGYTIRKLENDQFLDQIPDGGGLLTGYFKNGKVEKINEWIVLSSCTITTVYYIENNNLIFTYTIGSEFPYIDSLNKFDNKNSIKKMECKFFYHNGAIVKSILTGSTRCDDKPSLKLGKQYALNFTKYRKLLTVNNYR